MSKGGKPCIFCTQSDVVAREIGQSEYFKIVRDKYPVTEDHLLLISKRHVSDFFELDQEEQLELTGLFHRWKTFLMGEDPTITGFNIGMNCGKSAGQTVMHFHCHLIPRRDGDMEFPAGGVRGVIPERQKY